MKKECNALSLVFIFLFKPNPPPPPQKKQRKVATVSGTGRNDENGPHGENANRGPERHEKTVIHHPVRSEREKILLSYSTNKTVL